MTPADQREKLIEAMARARCLWAGINPDFRNPFAGVPGVPPEERVAFAWQTQVPDVEAALTAIAEQGYAVVPREATELMAFAGREACFTDDAIHIPDEVVCKQAYDGIVNFADLARPEPAAS